MRNILFCLVGFFLLVIGCPGQERGLDVLKMKNGDVIKGKLVSFDKGTLKFKPEWGKPISMSLDSVYFLETAAEVSVKFKDGRKENVRIRLEKGSKYASKPGIIIGPDLESLGIQSINLPEPKYPKISGSISSGATAARGNSRFESLSLAGEIVFRWAMDRLGGDFNWIYQRSYNSSTHSYYLSQRAMFLGAKYDRFISKKVFSYAMAKGETNYKQRIEWRAQGGVGLGYQVFEKETSSLGVELGISYDRREYKDDISEGVGSFRGAIKSDQMVSKMLHFLEKGEYLFSFEDSKDQSANTSVIARAFFAKNFFAQAEWDFRWLSKVPKGVKRSDVEYIFSIGWRF